MRLIDSPPEAFPASAYIHLRPLPHLLSIHSIDALLRLSLIRDFYTLRIMKITEDICNEVLVRSCATDMHQRTLSYPRNLFLRLP